MHYGVQVLGVTSDDVAEVTTSEEFQEALRSGVTHVYITDHIDMTEAPLFSDNLVSNAAVAGVFPSSEGRQTKTIRVRCLMKVFELVLCDEQEVPVSVSELSLESG